MNINESDRWDASFAGWGSALTVWSFRFCPLGDSYDHRDVVPLQLHLEGSSPALQTFNVQHSIVLITI